MMGGEKMKKLLGFLLAFFLLFPFVAAPAMSESKLSNEVKWNSWYQDERACLTVQTLTPMEGQFFTDLWGGTTSDIDVRTLLHAASPVCWDNELGRLVFDRNVVEDAVILTNGDGSRTYMMVLADDLRWSDGTPITVRDYAFSLLLQMDPAVAETGGRPKDFSWLAGTDEYLGGQTQTLTGVRIIADNILQITVKAEALPYFYELDRLDIHPYPTDAIAPRISIRDDGEGVYLTKPLTAELLQKTVLDETRGYLSHPGKVSGPYMLESFDGVTAKFAVNPYYKGTEDGYMPRIGRIEFTAAANSNMVSSLIKGEAGLLDKVTKAETISDGISCVTAAQDSLAMQVQPRSGLTMLWFMESNTKVQEKAVREAIACCFDRDTFTRLYTGEYGVRTDGFFGPGQWMYRKAAGMETATVNTLPEEGITLPGLTRYEPDRGKAINLLEEAGWILNKKGENYNQYRDSTRFKQTENGLIGLDLTLAFPESEDIRKKLEMTLVTPLKEVGISLSMVPVSMDEIEAAYMGRKESPYDILYLGQNFAYVFSPDVLKPRSENDGDSELYQAREETYALALDMVRTEPDDTAGFVKKWTALQKKISETLPLLPVYSNLYYEFFTRELHQFDISRGASWAEAIVYSYMSDMEKLSDEERQRIRNGL